ncbi:unnamed protein product [Ilex paraguariensis]|uniref:SAM domain-containing protein n=1 Tax=Ilex paraguariensis TaxID=185542 RepID=A0ABC8SZM4_9AQUA
MSKPRITITLGRSGQRVVKGASVKSAGSRAESQPLSGRKRSAREIFESNADNSSSFAKTRLRGDRITRSAGGRGLNDAQIGRNDLRLKLMRKRTSRRIQREIEERTRIELREKMSRPIQSTVGPERGLLRNLPPTRGNDDFLPMDSLRRSYASQTSDGLTSKSSDRFQKANIEMSPPRNVNQVHRMSSGRPIDDTRTGQLMCSDLLQPSRPKDPAPVTMRATLDAGKPASKLPPAGLSVPRSSYHGEQPPTVSSLLHSLGLGKYAIHFQAEEVDMAALNQMGDRDLKELGLPMGPRKKILLAILSLSKRKP